MCASPVLLFWVVAFDYAKSAERAGDTTALPSEGNENVFTGPNARYVVTVEAAGARCAIAADLDGDGDLDIVSVSSNDNTVAWYERLADGTYGPKNMITSASNGARIVATGDIDQDGKMDVIVASYYDHTIGWFQNVAGGFGPMNIVTRSANSAQGVSLADLDNDGDLDILSASSGDNTVAWYENLGEGFFCELKNVIDSQSMGVRTVAAADFDRDGYMDMAVASKDDNRVAWYKNDGFMNFQKVVIDDEAGGSYSLVIADVDKDGNLDIVGAANAEGKDVSGAGEGGKVNFYRGDGKGTFVKVAVTGPNDYDWFVLSVWSGDLDGDGDEDIASASFSLLHHGSISWYENVDGRGHSWLRHKIYTTPTSGTGHYVFGADMDGDGDNDLVAVTNGDNKVQVLYAQTKCDDSFAKPRRDCCLAHQYWSGSQCVSCTRGRFKDSSHGSTVCSSCTTACPRQGLAFLPQSCWSMRGCSDMKHDIARCDCGENRFLDKGSSTCQTCADGMITRNDRKRSPSDYNMISMKFLDQTTYMISDLTWQGFNSSRCEIPVCQPGHFFNMSRKDCQSCSAGTYSHGGSIVECSLCWAGSMCPDKTAFPISCQAGYFSEAGQAECTKSPQGKICPQGGCIRPRPCPPGRFADGEGMQECRACTWGTYAEGSKHGTDACLPCPRETTTAIVGAKSVQECVCKKGTYHFCKGSACDAHITNASAPGFCLDCPEGAVCEGPPESPNAMITRDGQHRAPQVPSGFMSIEASVYKCGADGKACPGSFMFAPIEQMCSYQGRGVACATCLPKYYWDGDHCEECVEGSAIPSVLVVLGLILASGAFVFYWNHKAEKVEAVESVLASVTIGVTISFMQTVGVFSRLYFAWPSELKWLMNIMNLLIFDLNILKFGCVFRESLATKTIPSLLMPIATILVFILWHPVSVIVSKLSRRRFKVFKWNAILNALGMILQAFYISIVVTVADAFDCYRSPNGKRALRISPSDICWEGKHLKLVVVSTVAAVVYVIGFFAFLIYIVILAPLNIVDKSFALRYNFVFFKYSPDCWWFGLPLLVRSIFTSLVTVASPDDGYVQFLLMLFVLVTFAFWHLMYLPYLDRYANNLETAELGILIVMLGLGSWFMSRKDGRSNADDDPEQARILTVVLVVFFVICGIMVLSVFVYALYKAANPLKAQNQLQKKLEPMLPNIRAAGLILKGIDSNHLRQLLQNASYLDVRALLRIVDCITVEVGGVQPDARRRSRLPRMATGMRRSSNSRRDLINAAVSMGLGTASDVSEIVHRRSELKHIETSADSAGADTLFIDSPCEQSASYIVQSVGRPLEQSVSRPIEQSVSRTIEQSVRRPIVSL